jgi:hypothetical protein
LAWKDIHRKVYDGPLRLFVSYRFKRHGIMEAMPRDEFLESTKQFLAFRASHTCSYSGCTQHTIGPSDESPIAFTNIGEAAHICAAAPGGRRYVAEMTPEERKHINNGIWFCATHARLVDRDESTYTINDLRRMKEVHEARCAARVRLRQAGGGDSIDLIALGPDIVCTGEQLELGQSKWVLKLSHFVVGSFDGLASFIDSFDRIPSSDRFVCLNSLGDGRLLSAAPVVRREGGALYVDCSVAPNYPRVSAQELGSRMAISEETGDTYLENGNIARVAGVKSFPQMVKSVLSIQRGEFFMDPQYGVRFAEYLEAFRGTPWLDELLKLDVVRQASIPYQGAANQREHTPLNCVERVVRLKIGEEDATERRLSLELELEVKGMGHWTGRMAVHLPRL